MAFLLTAVPGLAAQPQAQTVLLGRSWQGRAIRASRSESGLGPDSYTPLIDRQRQGKLRFRSTPCAF